MASRIAQSLLLVAMALILLPSAARNNAQGDDCTLDFLPVIGLLTSAQTQANAGDSAAASTEARTLLANIEKGCMATSVVGELMAVERVGDYVLTLDDMPPGWIAIDTAAVNENLGSEDEMAALVNSNFFCGQEFPIIAELFSNFVLTGSVEVEGVAGAAYGASLLGPMVAETGTILPDVELADAFLDEIQTTVGACVGQTWTTNTILAR